MKKLSEILLNEQKLSSPDDIKQKIDALILDLYRSDLPTNVSEQIKNYLRQAGTRLDEWLQEYYDRPEKW
jgi:hypothetical protein